MKISPRLRWCRNEGYKLLRVTFLSSLVFPHITKAEALTVPFLDSLFKDVCVVNSSAKDRGDISLWDKKQCCLKSWKIDLVSPFGARDRQACQYQKNEFPKLSVPLLFCNFPRVLLLPDLLPSLCSGNWAQENVNVPPLASVVNDAVLCLSPMDLVSSLNIHGTVQITLLACK